ncbi:MAG: ChbG/HpnK family deacetylase [Terracidiphilus sp.]|nr:ChbG/HpnK family deacetylase [Terracidiphilus sp.]
MRQIIVNADDFGLTRGVNRAILELNLGGVLTSATLMANASASDDAIELALNTPSLAVGCHVVLVDGTPVLPPSAIPTLIDPQTGQFHRKLTTFLRLLLSGRIHPADIEREAAAQITRLTQSGLHLTHIDTHKHTHMFPGVLRPVLQAARATGIPTVRNPFEPLWSLRATPTAPIARRIEVNLLHNLQASFRRIVASHGFATTDGSLGILATGSLNAETIPSLVHAIPEGTWELVTHPGYNDPDLAQVTTRLKESREIERAALAAVTLEEEIKLVTFAALGRQLPT